MALITGSNNKDTEFTPAAGAFTAQINNSQGTLLRRAAGTGTPFARFATVAAGESVNLTNPVAGFIYKWETTATLSQKGNAEPTITMRCDQ